MEIHQKIWTVKRSQITNHGIRALCVENLIKQDALYGGIVNTSVERKLPSVALIVVIALN